MLNIEQKGIIDRLREEVRLAMPEDPTAYDWPHVFRVEKIALEISKIEGGNEFLIHLIALTHDLYDHKFFSGTEEEAKAALNNRLKKLDVNEDVILQVVNNVFSLSFKGGKNKSANLSLEGKIVQDADRIEAIGAIGIARAFAYGGFKKRSLKSESSTETTHQHFYDKLLLLFDLLNTKTAKNIAADRFEFMKEFVKRLEGEWG